MIISPDHEAILGFVTDGASVLDLGCGNGNLLSFLIQRRNVKAQGIEIDDKSILECVAKGLNVFHDDIDTGLPEYEDKSFDFVILNQSIQQVRQPETVLQEALRVGKKIIVGLPNFAYINARMQIFFRGRVPVTPSLPYEWYNTPNLHFLSLADFLDYCRKKEITIGGAYYINGSGRIRLLPNLFAQIGLFLLWQRSR
ncbi:MAG TPA: methionine biosynthesis protein MetW [Syntrophorhabdaceae bacterium]|nr:methionine biosynthesis protein MetW [Syntrophorhabdaceae bacterium]